ncbi:hypothetical protein [uncultured Methanolobus sp.]|uniref:hypothetical protein n=1 Tax=uncultured Methanolobus sp. TaxID=218300 RepID=UPI0029C8DBF7|nr:hypothetical protein [uncultured Methanolobus sp.]
MVSPLEQELKIENVTNMYPGRLVKKGTNDDDMVVNTAAGATLGWLGYEQTNPAFMPTDIDTIYALDDMAAVLYGGRFPDRWQPCIRSERDQRCTSLVRQLLTESLPQQHLSWLIPVPPRLHPEQQTGRSSAVPFAEEGLVVAITQQSVDASSAAADVSWY